jgi:hypothetical protein
MSGGWLAVPDRAMHIDHEGVESSGYVNGFLSSSVSVADGLFG